MAYKFGPYVLDGRNLYRDGTLVQLQPQELRLLQVLAEQAVRSPEAALPKSVIKEEIVRRIWGDDETLKTLTNVDGSLAKVASNLRRKLRQNPDDRPYIAESDYRLDATVERVERESVLSSKALERDESSAGPDEPSRLEGVNPDVSPYPGPTAFKAGMAHRFFGRREETKELLKVVGEHRIVLVYSPSGAGKSSLLNTEVSQRLEQEFRYQVFTGVRVGGASPDVEEGAAIRNIFTFSAVSCLGLPPNPRCRLADALRSISRKRDAAGRVLVLDQFEELFTKYPERFKDKVDFFRELLDALEEDSSLRVILAIRQEYLADMNQLAEGLPEGLSMGRFHLQRMTRPNALEAVTMPISGYAKFAEDVAEEIVAQLNIIKVPGYGPDGAPIEMPGEFIETVHLQIVCKRLWESLPLGIKLIEMEHLQQATGETKTFKEFVVNALDVFYKEVVKKVAGSEESEARGGYSKELIFFGCMQFITPALTRMMVRRSHERVGRLPDWVVWQLVNEHLLVGEQRGGEWWYELAHDRLVDPVSRRKDHKVDSLLYAADLLEKVLGKVREDNGGNLKGYFDNHEEILAACQPFLSQAGIYQDEAELLFRASLMDSSGQAQKWSQKLHREYPPQVRLDVLSEAVRSEQWEVRRHTAELLGRDPVDELLPELARLATEDEDADVRRAAAESLARLDGGKLRSDLVEQLFGEVVGRLRDPASQARAETALSYVRIAADRRGNAPIFESCFRRVSRSRRAKIRGRALALQLWEGLPILLCIVIPAGFFAAISAAVFKLLPAFFGWALTQETANAGPGAFQGFTAGVIWAGGIVLGLTIYYIISEQEQGSKSLSSQLYAVAVGAASGFIGSAMIVLVVVAVFNMSVLEQIGWIMPRRQRFSLEFWHDLFVNTRYAWPYLITGAGLGVGMALTTNRLRTSARWYEFKEAQSQLTTFRQTVTLLGGITRILFSFRHAWPIPVMLLVAGVLAFFVPEVATDGRGIRAGALGLGKGIIGDCATQAVGAYFGIVGMGFGIVIVRWGFNLKPRRI